MPGQEAGNPSPETREPAAGTADRSADPDSSLVTMPGLSQLKGESEAQLAAQSPDLGTLPDYKIGSGDVLQISVWKEPEVSVDGVAVRSDGKISLPLIREVYAVGLKPVELEALLTREFTRFINNPAVTVIVKQINSQKVFLVGGVVRPGSIPLLSPMTVLQVLSEAGGLTDYAKKKKIYILRNEGGQESRLQFNYEAFLKGDSPEQNVRVRPGDTIVVPE